MPTIQLSTQYFQGRSKEVTGQNILNMYIEENPQGSQYPFAIYGCAGLTEWLDIGTIGAIHGMHTMNGVLYAVCENRVYQITKSKVKTFLGYIDNIGRVSIADNGFQVIIITETSGYIINSGVLTKITDADFPLAGMVEYFINYFVVIVQNTGRFNWSDALDGTSWNALNFITSEKKSDYLVGLINFNDALWLFGESTIEIYVASGSEDAPFQYYQGSVNSTRGCGAKYSIFADANQLFWLGDDRIIYTNNGYTPLRISNHAIEKEITDMATIDDAIAFTYTQDGHKFYILTFPTENKTYSYDILTKMWSRRSSFNLGRWRANASCDFVEKQLIGDYANGKIYYIDPLNYTENDEVLERTIYTTPLFQENMRIVYHSITLDIDSGFAKTTGQGSNPQVMMQFSNDGGYTWSNENWKSTGEIGEYNKELIWRRCGMARNRLIRFTLTDPVPFRVIGCYADISGYSM
jgi:hypothetical protein